jgi:hypothetical protein
MPKLISIWDLSPEAGEGPVEVQMYAVHADDACHRDPKRYCRQLPHGVQPGAADAANKKAAQDRVARDEADRQRLFDEHFERTGQRLRPIPATPTAPSRPSSFHTSQTKPRS